jgi:phospholipid/cholesterol/gamma-HCH transport system substrate-binding protein
MDNKLETIVGFIVLVVAGGFLFFTYKATDVKTMDNTYIVKAKFDQVEGIIIGSDVRLSGIKVGSVVGLKLDPDNYNAVMTTAVNAHVKLPMDSSMKIVTSGLLGGKYVLVDVGGSEEMIPSGGEIRYTQSSINLESLISKFMFNSDSKESDTKKH